MTPDEINALVEGQQVLVRVTLTGRPINALGDVFFTARRGGQDDSETMIHHTAIEAIAPNLDPA